MNDISKKFRGWILPEQFIPHYQHVHKSRYSAFLGPLVGLRQPAHVVSKPTKEKEIYLERIVYVGCIHGGNEDIYSRLVTLTKYPPDYLIFAGDITGSTEIERLKKHFYDEKQNNPKNPYTKFEYFGDWAATLPKERREGLLSTLAQNAERLLKIIQKIQKHGTSIYIVEGNWDNPLVSGIQAIAGKDITGVFDTQSFFKKNGFLFRNKIEVVKTKTTMHILLPYIDLLYFDLISKHQLQEIQNSITEARKQGKAIIMVGHAEANWRIHHLQNKQSLASGERGKVIKNFGHAMVLFSPDEVIYPHQHSRIRDERGKLIDLNAKYMLQITHDGVHLVDNPNKADINNKEIMVTYIPLGFLAQEDYIGYGR